MDKTARDVMQAQVLTVSPDAPLHTVQRLFYEEGIHGAPVVDEEGRVQGMISSSDILRAATEEHESAPYGSDEFEERLADKRVSDFMTPEVVTVGLGETIPSIARSLRENAIHRVLVVEDGTLRGIVSTLDLMRLLEAP